MVLITRVSIPSWAAVPMSVLHFFRRVCWKWLNWSFPRRNSSKMFVHICSYTCVSDPDRVANNRGRLCMTVTPTVRYHATLPNNLNFTGIVPPVLALALAIKDNYFSFPHPFAIKALNRNQQKLYLEREVEILRKTLYHSRSSPSGKSEYF